MKRTIRLSEFLIHPRPGHLVWSEQITTCTIRLISRIIISSSIIVLFFSTPCTNGSNFTNFSSAENAFHFEDIPNRLRNTRNVKSVIYIGKWSLSHLRSVACADGSFIGLLMCVWVCFADVRSTKHKPISQLAMISLITSEQLPEKQLAQSSLALRFGSPKSNRFLGMSCRPGSRRWMKIPTSLHFIWKHKRQGLIVKSRDPAGLGISGFSMKLILFS